MCTAKSTLPPSLTLSLPPSLPLSGWICIFASIACDLLHVARIVNENTDQITYICGKGGSGGRCTVRRGKSNVGMVIVGVVVVVVLVVVVVVVVVVVPGSGCL